MIEEKQKLSIDFTMLSNKQLSGQCLDIVGKALFQALQMYSKFAKIDSPKSNDIPKLTGLFIERFDAIMDFLGVKDISDRLLVKSWLHEIKYIRNMWAHGTQIDDRLVFRLYDTSHLLFLKLKANPGDSCFQRLTKFRELTVLKWAQTIRRE